MWSLITSLFSSGAVNSLERVATEWIETDTEKAEAKTLLIKALDPNGKMRRDLSRFASKAYGFYLVATVILIFMSVWGLGGDICTTVGGVEACTARADIAAGRMTELFLPITGSWGAIVTASFGVNATNAIKGN